MLRVLSSDLMSEDLGSSSSSIDLRIVEASQLVECHLTISVEYEYWQEDVLL